LESISALDTKPRDCSDKRALVIVLRKLGIGPSSVDLGGKLRRLLRLDRAVDDCEDLAGADPAAGIDQHPNDAPALAGDADRLVTARGEGAAGGDGASDLASARHDDRHRRHLAGTGARPGARRLVAAAHGQEQRERQRREHCRGSD
jgi:hypothetical protein